MEGRSFAAIDADLVLVQHEITLAEPHRQQCPDTYAALTQRRDELVREREEIAELSPTSRWMSVSRREPAEASGSLPDEGVRSDAQPIRLSGHGGRVVIDAPAKEWAGASKVREEAKELPPPTGDMHHDSKSLFGLATPQERKAFFEDLAKPEHAELRTLKENVYRRCVERSSKREPFFWGLRKDRDKDKIEVIGHEFVHKDFYPKVRDLLKQAQEDLARDQKALDKSALRTIALGIASGCRNASEQLILWNKGFITNLYRGAAIPIRGPNDSRILVGGKKFRVDSEIQRLVRKACDGPAFKLVSEEATVEDYEIQWQKKVKKGKRTEDVGCELKEATQVMVRNAALLRLMKDGPGGDDAAFYLAGVMGKKIATPGWSRHQHGIAVDFSPPEANISIKFEHVAAWKKTWLFNWLSSGHAKLHDINNYEPEPWHWEDKFAAK